MSAYADLPVIFGPTWKPVLLQDFKCFSFALYTPVFVSQILISGKILQAKNQKLSQLSVSSKIFILSNFEYLKIIFQFNF